MLRTLLRAFAVAVLVLAVPVQGFAAVSAGICMALGHHGDAGAHAHETSSANQHAHAHDAAAEHGDDEDGAGEKASHVGHCAPCVSCCTVPAIAAYPPLAVAAADASPLVPAPLASFQGVAPHQLDRPPLPL